MNNGTTDKSGLQFSSAPLIASAVLVGVGTFFIFAGLAVGGSHVAVATRRWIREMEVPPSELAKLKYAQARAAVSAGTTAWQNGHQTQGASVS
jgi:hypothetical protein